MAGARQRLPDRRGGGASLGADAGAGALALRPALRGRLRRGAAALAQRGPRSSSPSCGSSTRTAPRPSSPATAPARRSSTCAATAGPTRTPSRSAPPPARSRRRSPGERTCSVEMGRAATESKDFPSGGPDGRGTLVAGGRDWDFQHVSIGNPQCAIVVERGARGPRPGGDRPEIEGDELLPEPDQRLLLQHRRQPGAGADLRARGGGDALLGDRRQRRRGDRLPARAPRARSWSSSTAASSRSRSPTTSTCG